jgi:thiamine kinase-like enzyme
MALTLEEAIARVPQWAGATDLKTSPLGGGITNKNYRIEVGEEVFVLRIAGANTELLGIDRKNEYAANKAAGELGIAAEVVYFIEPEGYLVTRFVAGRPLPPEEIGQPENIRRVVEAIKKIHSMSPIPGTFSPFRVVEDATEIARRYNVAFPENFDWLTEHMREVEAAFLKDPGLQTSPRPCHNDLLNANFLDDGQIRILDWEYAGMGDIFFDLANFSAHHGFSDEQDRWLLECYFGEVTAARWARLKLMKPMSDFRESMWGMVQIGISRLDFDFLGYADKHFDRTTRSMQNPHWGQWIDEVVPKA